MFRYMIGLGLIGILVNSVDATIGYAQGGGGAPVPCYIDVIRNCAGMAANASPPKPSLACEVRRCEEVLGVLECSAVAGLKVTDPALTYHDVRQTVPPEAGRTGKSSIVSPWMCGKIGWCKCNPGSTFCITDLDYYGFIEKYFPVEWATYGPIDC